MGLLPAPPQHLANLKTILDSDPTDIEAANRYWAALGSLGGHNVKSGAFVIEAFRGCALDSREGVIAFCRAFCELFEKTGEEPQPDLFDEELLGALESWLPDLSIYDHCLASWLLNLSSHRPL